MTHAKEENEKAEIREEVTLVLLNIITKSKANNHDLTLKDLYSSTNTQYNLNKENGLKEEIDSWESITDTSLEIVYRQYIVYINNDFSLVDDIYDGKAFLLSINCTFSSSAIIIGEFLDGTNVLQYGGEESGTVYRN